MVGETFILRVYHFWMSNKQILKYARFRPILSHFPLSTGQIFKLISPHENNIKIFQLKYISILHIKRQQKITQAKVFEIFTSLQHALLYIATLWNTSNTVKHWVTLYMATQRNTVNTSKTQSQDATRRFSPNSLHQGWAKLNSNRG